MRWAVGVWVCVLGKEGGACLLAKLRWRSCCHLAPADCSLTPSPLADACHTSLPHLSAKTQVSGIATGLTVMVTLLCLTGVFENMSKNTMVRDCVCVWWWWV